MFIDPNAVAPFRLVCEHPIYCRITDAWLGVERHTEPETYATAIVAAVEAHARQEEYSEATWHVVDANGKPAFYAVAIPESPSPLNDEIPF